MALEKEHFVKRDPPDIAILGQFSLSPDFVGITGNNENDSLQTFLRAVPPLLRQFDYKKMLL